MSNNTDQLDNSCEHVTDTSAEYRHNPLLLYDTVCEVYK